MKVRVLLLVVSITGRPSGKRREPDALTVLV